MTWPNEQIVPSKPEVALEAALDWAGRHEQVARREERRTTQKEDLMTQTTATQRGCSRFFKKEAL